MKNKGQAMKCMMIAVVGLMTGVASQATAKPLKVFILAGQSNMEGQGLIEPSITRGTLAYTAANDPEGVYRFLRDGNGKWAVRKDVWIKYGDSRYGELTVGYGANPAAVGPELGFGPWMADLLKGQVLIVKAAWGGKSLGADFRPPSSGGTTGPYYKEILRLVKDATDNIGKYFPGYVDQGYTVAGFAWHQGWNDRCSPEFSAEYETNMSNFIKDMRKDLGVPNLPFVIASTGMDGGTNYTKVELAQKALADTKTHPEFVGNVAVIDCRKSYEGLTFWEDAENSPTTQGFHWNGNAKTYVNIGLAMADAMSMMTLGRNPFRLRATGEADGVMLRWQNGSTIPTSVRILRNGVEIAATAQAKTASYLDKTAKPGTCKYELIFAMPDASRESLTMTFNGGITDLNLAVRQGENVLTWVNNMAYDSIRVFRNGTAIGSALPGTTTTFKDTTPINTGLLTYSVVPAKCKAAQATVQRDFNLRCELGILDLTANDGINPATRKPWKAGDQYRLAFVSSVGTKTESKDLSTYDTFLQKLAADVKVGGTWKVIGSSDTVDARDHTSTNPDKNGFGVAIFLLDGKTMLAHSSPDLWSGSVRTKFDRTERGTTYSGSVYTGTNENGTRRGDCLGSARPNIGTSTATSRHWTVIFGDAAANAHPVYALSDPLTISSR